MPYIKWTYNNSPQQNPDSFVSGSGFPFFELICRLIIKSFHEAF